MRQMDKRKEVSKMLENDGGVYLVLNMMYPLVYLLGMYCTVPFSSINFPLVSMFRSLCTGINICEMKSHDLLRNLLIAFTEE